MTVPSDYKSERTKSAPGFAHTFVHFNISYVVYSVSIESGRRDRNLLKEHHYLLHSFMLHDVNMNTLAF